MSESSWQACEVKSHPNCHMQLDMEWNHEMVLYVYALNSLINDSVSSAKQA